MIYYALYFSCANDVRGFLVYTVLSRYKSTFTKIRNLIKNSSSLFLAIVFSLSVALYYFPTQFSATVIICFTMIVTIFVGHIFLDENEEYSHHQGMMLGILSIVSVTVGFGAIYSFILITSNYTIDHFRFTEDIEAERIVNNKLTRNYVSMMELIIERSIKNIESGSVKDADKKLNSFRGPPAFSEKEISIIKKKLRGIFFREKGMVSGSLNNLVAHHRGARATEKILSELTRAMAEKWRETYAKTNYIDTNLSNYLTLDIVTRDLYPDGISRDIFDVYSCYYVKKISDGNECKLTVEDRSKIVDGTEAMFRLYFSQLMFFEISNYDLSSEDSELVFTAMLFSAMSLMTSGYSDMTPQTKLARIIVILQFLSYIVVVLFILPIGISKTSSKK